MNILKFLRENNRQEQEQFGMVLDRSNARDSSEARLTQAYIEARGLQYSLRVGYCDSDGLFRVTHLPPLIEAQAAKESTSDRLSLV